MPKSGQEMSAAGTRAVAVQVRDVVKTWLGFEGREDRIG